MDNFHYTVVIRTLGKAGDKYLETLRSIQRQSCQPDDIIVILPFGYDRPKETLGIERYVNSPKGMVEQRVYGFEICNTNYILSIDDDLYFNEDFVESLYHALIKENADFVSPCVILSTDKNKCKYIHCTNSPQKIFTLSNLTHYLLGVSYIQRRKDNYILTVSKTGGFIMNVRVDEPCPNLCQSGHGTIVFGKTNAARRVEFNDEKWVEKTGYALMEDQIFYYKAFILGFKIVYDPKIVMLHLDANTTITHNKKLANVYASSKNNLVFWHRFIWKQSNSLGSLLSLSRRLFFTLAASALKNCVSKETGIFKTYLRGYRDGILFLNSKEYKSIPEIVFKDNK